MNGKLQCSNCQKSFRTRNGFDYHVNRAGHGVSVTEASESVSGPSRNEFLAMCGEAFDEMNGQIAAVQFLTPTTLQAMGLLVEPQQPIGGGGPWGPVGP